MRKLKTYFTVYRRIQLISDACLKIIVDRIILEDNFKQTHRNMNAYLADRTKLLPEHDSYVVLLLFLEIIRLHVQEFTISIGISGRNG